MVIDHHHHLLLLCQLAMKNERLESPSPIPMLSLFRANPICPQKPPVSSDFITRHPIRNIRCIRCYVYWVYTVSRIFGIYNVTYIQFHLTLLHTTPYQPCPLKRGRRKNARSLGKHPRRRGDGYWPGADEISGKKAGRIISEWLRMSAAGQRPLAGFPYFKTDQKPKN